MGRSYVNLFMGHIENQFFNQYGRAKQLFKAELYGRYIDDYVMTSYDNTVVEWPTNILQVVTEQALARLTTKRIYMYYLDINTNI